MQSNPVESKMELYVLDINILKRCCAAPPRVLPVLFLSKVSLYSHCVELSVVPAYDLHSSRASTDQVVLEIRLYTHPQ